MRYKLLITVSFFLFFFLLNGGTSFGQAQQAFERGMEELYRGNISRALEIWHSSYEQSENVDSRIGFEFIRVVTAHQMRNYYEPATNLYYRAITDGENMKSRVALRQEIERLKPIIGDGIFRQWIDWWDEENPNLSTDMKGFWIQQDPTPANATNERLIEHWQRIAAAKEQFTKNEKTVYGTDERALIYIRYGEPDRTKNGILTLQSYTIKRWLEEQLAPDTGADERPPDNVEATEDKVMARLQSAIYEFHRYPEYEIWFYDQIVESQDDQILFLFGTDVRNDEFSLQTSLEDLIPERAFHANNEADDQSVEFTRAGITPALILQLLYYEQLALVDEFFENRLNELKDKILEQGIQAFQGMDLAFKSESKEIINKQVMQAPQETSTYTGLIPKIPLHVYQYRLLSDSLKPEILTYIESSAHEAFLIDYNRNMGQNLQLKEEIEDGGYNVLDEFTFYELNHTLQAYDKSWQAIINRTDHPPLFITAPSEKRLSTTVFRQPHKGKIFQAISAELMNYDPDSRSVYQTPFSPALRGWNKYQYRQPNPLVSHPDTLEVSDLILGYNHPDRVTDPFDFKVANNRLIPFGETLLLHFEVYNLKMQPDGFSHFEMTYRILPVNERGKVFADQTEFILTLNFTNEEPVVREDLEIETAQLTPGFYELNVSILDTESDQTRERKIRFEVVE